VIGTLLHGEVREVGGSVVAYQTANDTNLPAYTGGFSGLFAFSQNPIPPTDVTWDNFASQGIPEPATSLLLAMGSIGLGTLGRGKRASRKA
jgi:hypothetical protein